MPRKCILLLLDGLGDRSFAELNNQTPLQAAKTPNLDKLSKLGSNGLFHASSLGEPLPSEFAHLIMFGYKPNDYPGRGPLEALGYDLEIKQNEVAMLARFIEVSNDKQHYTVINRWPELPEEILSDFRDKISNYNSTNLIYQRSEKTFGVMKLTKQYSAEITDTDPIIEGLPLYKCQSISNAINPVTAQITADYINRFTAWCLQNMTYQNRTFTIAIQRSGKLSKLKSFYETNGLQGASISSGKIYKGIAKYSQMNYIPVKDSDDIAADYIERIQLALENLQTNDFIHVHTKMPDKAGHKKDPIFKKHVIEQLDIAIGDMLPKLINDEILLVVSADHSTPSCGEMLHSGEPVPVIFVGSEVRIDLVKKFSEIHAANGCMGLMRGGELFAMILNYLDRARLYGFQENPENKQYWPSKGLPF